MQSSIAEISELVKAKQHRIVGISGVPGAGKSTLAKKLAELIPNCKSLSMDGFHIYRKDLSPEGLKRRGAPFTFDYAKFREKMLQIKKQEPTKFPIFNHEEKDPVEDAVQVEADTPCIIVEGLYIFDPGLEIDEVWDLRVWVEIEEQEATQRVIEYEFGNVGGMW